MLIVGSIWRAGEPVGYVTLGESPPFSCALVSPMGAFQFGSDGESWRDSMARTAFLLPTQSLGRGTFVPHRNYFGEQFARVLESLGSGSARSPQNRSRAHRW